MIHSRHIVGTVGYMGGLAAVLEKFCWAWGQMIQFNTEFLCRPGELVHYVKSTVSFHAFARNSIVEQMKGEWLLMLDTDHEFEPDIAARMVNAMNKYDLKVLSATYCHRAGPHSPVLYHWAEDNTLAPIGDWDPTATALQVGSAGGGTLMVKREVFETIRDQLRESPFEIIPPFGEDHSFFKRLKTLGIPAYALPSIESPHLDVTALRLSGYDRAGLKLETKEVEGYR